MDKLYIVKNSKIHGKGVFASCDIKKGEKVIEYLGEKISKQESNKRGLALFEESKKSGKAQVFIFELDDELDLDGNVEENDAKYINHSCSPNCESINEDNHIWICSIKDIKKGEELSFDYGYSYEFFFENPCFCKSSNCIGYIVAQNQRAKVLKLLNNKKRKSKKLL